MQHLEVSCAVRRVYRSLGVKGLKIYNGLHIHHPLFLLDFNGTYIFLMYFRIIYKISWKSIKWEQSCSMRIDGDRQTDRRKLMVALHNFPNAPKICRKLRTFRVQVWLGAEKGENLSINRRAWKWGTPSEKFIRGLQPPHSVRTVCLWRM